MRGVRSLLTAAFICAASTPVFAVEGPSAAGPIGGYDIRSAQLPPPGLHGGVIVVGGPAFDFVDGDGETIPALRELRYLAAPSVWEASFPSVAFADICLLVSQASAPMGSAIPT